MSYLTAMQPPYGYAPTYPNQQPHPYQQGGPSTAGIASIAKPTLAFLGIRAAFPIFSWVFWKAWGFVGAGLETRLLVSKLLEGVRGLISFVAIVFFLVWFTRVYSWVRATRGETKYTNTMAVAGWFIPFANFFLPYAAMRDAWRRGMNDENGGLVVVWWLAYLGTIVFTIFYAVLENVPGMFEAETARAVFPLVGLVSMVVNIAAWGAWFYLVQRLTKRATTGT